MASTWDAMTPEERQACVDAGRLPDLDGTEDAVDDDWDDGGWDDDA